MSSIINGGASESPASVTDGPRGRVGSPTRFASQRALGARVQSGGSCAGSGSGPSLARAAASPRENREMQTESSFYPSDVRDTVDQLTDLHCNEFQQLQLLRSHIQESFSEFTASVYDLFSFKDVMLEMSSKIADMPVTDLLLISSKLFRRTSQLALEVGAMFKIVFAENFVDDHFRFTEVRLLKKENMVLKQELEAAKADRDHYQQLYTSLSDGAKSHETVVETLEDRNDVLEVRASALEDQMAVLFQQLTDDFVFYNEDLLRKTGESIEVQDQLSATRSTFMQSITAVQNRLRFFQNMLVEIQEDAAIVNLDGAGSVKARIKALDVHVQHIIARFTSVKDGLAATSQELVQALIDKRNVLNFAVQHLKLYDAQNSKLRASRALMHQLRQKLTEIERALTHTFATGSLVRVDRGGDVHINFPVQPDGTQARRNRYAVDHIREVASIVEGALDVSAQVTAHLDTEDEQRTLLKNISLATPSTVRNPVGSGASGATGSGSGSGSGSVTRTALGNLAAGPSARLAAAAAGVDGAPGLQNYSAEQYQQLRDDFATKMTFMREVYEERIADLESKVEAAAERVRLAQHEASAAAIAANKDSAAAAPVVGTAAGQKKERDKDDNDRETALKAKERWEATRAQIFSREQDSRHQALGALHGMEADIADANDLVANLSNAGASTAARAAEVEAESRSLERGSSSDAGRASAHRAMRSYISPLYRLSGDAAAAAESGGGGGGGGSDSAPRSVPIATSLPPALARTAYSREQQQRNAETLKTMRRLTMAEQCAVDDEDKERGRGEEGLDGPRGGGKSGTGMRRASTRRFGPK